MFVADFVKHVKIILQLTIEETRKIIIPNVWNRRRKNAHFKHISKSEVKVRNEEQLSEKNFSSFSKCTFYYGMEEAVIKRRELVSDVEYKKCLSVYRLPNPLTFYYYYLFTLASASYGQSWWISISVVVFYFRPTMFIHFRRNAKLQ